MHHLPKMGEADPPVLKTVEGPRRGEIHSAGLRGTLSTVSKKPLNSFTCNGQHNQCQEGLKRQDERKQDEKTYQLGYSKEDVKPVSWCNRARPRQLRHVRHVCLRCPEASFRMPRDLLVPSRGLRDIRHIVHNLDLSGFPWRATEL